MKPARVLLVDPPWKFRDKLPGNGRGADKHYQTLTLHELALYPLPQLDDDAILLLWRVAAMPLAALALAKAWGFAPDKGEIVWIKTSGAFAEPDDVGELPAARLAFGMGRIVRGAHEVCLVCTRGRPVIRDRSVRSVFFAPRLEHSRKPDRIYQIAERLSAGPYVELFARRARKGWTQYGNQLEGRPAAPEVRA